VDGPWEYQPGRTLRGGDRSWSSGELLLSGLAVARLDDVPLVLRKADGADVDFLREGVRVLAQALMDAEVSAQIGAEHSQRTPENPT
jgi:hypothetical protein